MSVRSEVRKVLKEHLLREADDDVVCSFGADFFHGARDGAICGSISAAALCFLSFRRLQDDQREVDFLSGVCRGQRNPHFSRWILLRGIRTQPMLTVGCIALGTTSILKMVKAYLANRRCVEFSQDDMDFNQLAQWSRTDSKVAEEFHKMCWDAVRRPTFSDEAKHNFYATAQKHGTSSSPTAPQAAKSRDESSSINRLLQTTEAQQSNGRLIHRLPTYCDGVAVAVLGSVMDCYLPQKPVQRYHNMRFGTF